MSRCIWPLLLAEMEAEVCGEEVMPGYWNAHSDRDWQDECDMHDEPEPVDETIETEQLVETARRLLGRLSQHERWDCSARAYAEEAADILRKLGLPELAAIVGRRR